MNRLRGAAVLFCACLSSACLALGGIAQGDTIERLKAGDAFNIGYRVDAAPFSRALGAEELAQRRANAPPSAEIPPAIGFSVDLCKRIAAAVRAATRPDLEIAYIPVTAEDRFESLREGRVDILCGATTFTLSRQRAFDFSLFTFVTSASLLHRSGKVPRGFYGDRVGVIANSTSLATLRAQNQQFEPPIDIEEVPSHERGVELLRAGVIDSYFGDRVLLRQLMIESDGALSLSRLRLSNEPYALMTRKGDAELLFLVNRSLVDLYESEEIFDVFRRWFSGARPDPSLAYLYGVMAAPIGTYPNP